MSKKLILIVSKYNLFTGQVEKIIKDSNFKIEQLYIEDFVDKNIMLNLNKHDVVYFICCNSTMISRAINLINGGYIINKEFLLQNYKKVDIQKKLKENMLLVPKIYNINNINNIKFPIFCKQNIHQGITIQMFNKISCIKFFEKFNKKEFYLEESLYNNYNENIYEIKIYYINKKIYFENDNISRDEKLNQLAINISKCLNNLDIYSCDIFCKNGLYYIIDLNSSAGFYLSDESRKSFINFVGKI